MNNVEVTATENAGSKKYTKNDLHNLFAGIDEIYAARGKKTQYFDLRTGFPSLDEMESLVLGPTGNFRAPAVRKGRTLIVGFSDAHLKMVV